MAFTPHPHQIHLNGGMHSELDFKRIRRWPVLAWHFPTRTLASKALARGCCCITRHNHSQRQKTTGVTEKHWRLNWRPTFFSRTTAARSLSSHPRTPLTEKLSSSHPELPTTPGGCLQEGLTQVSPQVFCQGPGTWVSFLGLGYKSMMKAEALIFPPISQRGVPKLKCQGSWGMKVLLYGFLEPLANKCWKQLQCLGLLHRRGL